MQPDIRIFVPQPDADGRERLNAEIEQHPIGVRRLVRKCKIFNDPVVLCHCQRVFWLRNDPNTITPRRLFQGRRAIDPVR